MASRETLGGLEGGFREASRDEFYFLRFQHSYCVAFSFLWSDEHVFVHSLRLEKAWSCFRKQGELEEASKGL